MNMLAYAIRRMINAVKGELPPGQGGDRSATSGVPIEDEEHRQRVLRMVGRQLFGCEVAVYSTRYKGGHLEYVIVVLEDTPYVAPAHGETHPSWTDDDDDWPGDDAP